jgi:predicted nuclease of predicted toxin-antitoxin system
LRFVVDECTGPSVARWLREQGHDAFSVYEQARGLSDDAILEKAITENRILITNDTDFGDKIYRDGRRHRGIILLRLQKNWTSVTLSVLEELFRTHGDRIGESFVVVTENQVRFGR